MQNAAVIQARFGSSRLPGKILMDLCGKPVLEWVIERVQRSHLVDEVLVATSMERENLPVMELCARLGVRVFAGAENDVLDRYYQLAKLIRPRYLIRVTADCPCFDWMLLDNAIAAIKPDVDYLGDLGESLPDGLDLEIMTFDALEAAWRDAALNSEREHVTQFIRKRPDRFKIQDFSSPYPDVGHLRWTLDEAEDYQLIEQIYRHFLARGREDFRTQDILDYIAENPSISAINAKYTRNEGLAKSISEDFTIKDKERS